MERPMTPEQISATFRQARRAAKALDAYPGNEVPPDLDTAYTIQELGISAWPDRICGWKVAAIQPAWRETYPAERLAGPVFSRTLWMAEDNQVTVPVIENGYAAVEAEFAIRIAKDIPATARFAEPAELLPYVESVHAAIELAASPLATLSSLGPGAVISDFGNNSGLIVGPKLPMDLLVNGADMPSATEVNRQPAGTGGASRVPGGPLAAVLFLVEHLRARGRTLNAGEWVSTGATTGIHLVRPGDHVLATFGEQYRISAGIATAQAAA